jgi:hypothetical protein
MNVIQSGDSTHHQLQSIFPVSLSTMNTIVNTLGIPIPLLLLAIYSTSF